MCCSDEEGAELADLQRVLQKVVSSKKANARQKQAEIIQVGHFDVELGIHQLMGPTYHQQLLTTCTLKHTQKLSPAQLTLLLSSCDCVPQMEATDL